MKKFVAFHQVLKTVKIELHVQEPFFSQLKGNNEFLFLNSMFAAGT